MIIRKFRVQEKAWSLASEYNIYDENDLLVYRASGKKFALRRRLLFQNEQHESLFLIEDKIWSWRSRFYLKRDGEVICEVIKKHTIKPNIEVVSLSEAFFYDVEGNLWENQYTFLKAGQEVAFVSSNIWKLTGSYGVAILEGEKYEVILATVVVIDLIKHHEGS